MCAQCVFVSLTVCAFHLPIVACLYETDVSEVEDASDDLQYLSLDVGWDPDHLHSFLETTRQQRALRATVRGITNEHGWGSLEIFVLQNPFLHFKDCVWLMQYTLIGNVYYLTMYTASSETEICFEFLDFLP